MHETISDAFCQVSSCCRTATLVDINPAYTSQTGNFCLHLGMQLIISILNKLTKTNFV